MSPNIPNLVYVVVIGVLFATGVTLLLERSLTRVLMGVILLGNGANLLLLTGGRAGGRRSSAPPPRRTCPTRCRRRWC